MRYCRGAMTLILLLAASGCHRSQPPQNLPAVPPSALSGEEAFSAEGRCVRARWYAVDGRLRVVIFHTAYPLDRNRDENGPNGHLVWWGQGSEEQLHYAFDPRFPDTFIIGGESHDLSDGMVFLARTNTDFQQIPIQLSAGGGDPEVYRRTVLQLKEDGLVSQFVQSVLADKADNPQPQSGSSRKR